MRQTLETRNHESGSVVVWTQSMAWKVTVAAWRCRLSHLLADSDRHLSAKLRVPSPLRVQRVGEVDKLFLGRSKGEFCSTRMSRREGVGVERAAGPGGSPISTSRVALSWARVRPFQSIKYTGHPRPQHAPEPRPMTKRSVARAGDATVAGYLFPWNSLRVCPEITYPSLGRFSD